jgi:hypothetical protein
MSGVAQPSGDYGQDMKKTWTTVATDIARANPQLKDNPQALFQAVGLQIDQMKGLASEDRAYLKYQTDMASITERAQKDRESAQTANDKLAAFVEEYKAKLTAAEKWKADAEAGKNERAKESNKTKLGVAALGKEGKLGAAALGKEGRLGAAAMGAASKDKATAARSGDVAGTNQSRERQGLTAAQARENAAAIAQGKKPLYKLGQGGGGGGGGAPPQAVQLLKKNPTPQTRKQFDQVFGQGAAAKVLGS